MQHDSVIGTAIYMSPEVMRGGANDDNEGDPGGGGYGRSTVSYFVYRYHWAALKFLVAADYFYYTKNQCMLLR